MTARAPTRDIDGNKEGMSTNTSAEHLEASGHTLGGDGTSIWATGLNVPSGVHLESLSIRTYDNTFNRDDYNFHPLYAKSLRHVFIYISN